MPFVPEFERAIGTPPGEDGATNSYFYDSNLGPTCDWSPLIFVNGMMNDRIDHMKSAVLLSFLTERTVIGVFNQRGTSLWDVEQWNHLISLKMQQDSGFDKGVDYGAMGFNALVGFVADVVQCGTDKLVGYNPLVGRGTEGWGGADEDDVFTADKPYNPLTWTKRDYSAWTLTGGNRATVSLARLLNHLPRVNIVCHSQGNIITANAVNAVAYLRGGLFDWVRVHSLASPVAFWPEGLWVTKYVHNFDPVTWLGLLADHQGETVSNNKATHDAGVYMTDFQEQLKANLVW